MRGLEQIPWLYDACCTVFERLGLAEWRRWLAVRARGRTLEVGCGTGRNLPLYPASVRVVGVDPARDSLLRARRRASAIPLVQAEAEALPFRSAAFDTVVSSLAFCSVVDPARALGEVRRVMRSDGTLVMLEHVRSTRAWKAALQDRLQPLWTRLSGGCHPNRDTERLVGAGGFTIDRDTRTAKADLRRFEAKPVGTIDT